MTDVNELQAWLIKQLDYKTASTDFEFWDFWHEAVPGEVLELGDFGEFEVIEAEVGQAGTLKEWDGSGTTWNNWIILKHGDQYFRLNGEHDSWDPQGWDENLEEIHKVDKTVSVWERI